MPSTTLDTGPAIAISSSVLAFAGSSSISATPPKMNSVIPFIGRPKRLATMECQNS